MIGTFEIMQGTSTIGKVTVERQGLYYRIRCRCSLTGEVMHRLVVSSGEKREDLGTLVPFDGAFGLEKRVPVKKLGEGKPTFQLLPKHSSPNGRFIPVYPEEPFSYMSRLKEAYLEARNGQLGLTIPE